MIFNKKLTIFALGSVVGATLMTALKSEKFRKSCVKLIGKGMILQNEAMAVLESAKEAADDMVAEGKVENKKAQK